MAEKEPEEPDPSPPTAHTPAVTPTPVPTHPAGASTPVGGRHRATTAKSRSLPAVAASTAALLVGAAVGLAGCVLTYLGLQGCELVTGTDSCGGPGLVVPIVLFVTMVLLGAAALRALRVPDASNVSVLGVSVLTVVALVFLVDQLYDPWMFLVVPAVTAVGFAAARWVTASYGDDEPGDEDARTPRHEIP